MSEHDDRPQDGTDPTYAADVPDAQVPPATPAAYPPAAPYPPADASPPAAPAEPYAPAGPQAPEPYAPAAPYAPGSGQPVAPEQGQQPYGQQVPYGQGYGQSAPYTTTPQPYSYGPPPLTPEAEKVRSSAVLWTVLNGVAIFLCGNLLAIAGVIFAALAIGKTRDDVAGARSFVRWSWILFAIGFAFWLLIIIGYVVFFLVVGTASMSSGF